MVAQVQRLASQCGSQMRAIYRVLSVSRKDPRPTNALNYQQFIEQL